MKIIKIDAIWCPGCLVMRPVWKKIKEKYPIDIIEYDIDINSDEIKEFNIDDKLPVTIFIDNNNNELSRLIGEKNIEEIQKEIEKYQNKGV